MTAKIVNRLLYQAWAGTSFACVRIPVNDFFQIIITKKFQAVAYDTYTVITTIDAGHGRIENRQ